MQLAIPFTEALALATAREPLPPLVRSVRTQGSVVHAEIDLREVPNVPWPVQMLGTVPVTARLVSFGDGVATVAVTAHVRALPVHKLLPYVIGLIDAALRRQGLPPGLVEVRRDEGGPVLAIRVQDAVNTQVDGITVTGLGLRDDVIYAAATVGTVRLR